MALPALFYKIPKPQFILHPSYLYSKNPQVLLQRNLFLFAFNTPKKALIQTLLYLYWISINLWITVYTSVKKIPDTLLNTHQVTRYRLAIDLIKLGLYSLSAPQYFKYKLYTSASSSTILGKVYAHQLPNFHHYTNQDMPGYLDAVDLIADKTRFAHLLQTHGIPTIQSTLISTQKDLFQATPIFCKPNRAAQGKDAFLLDYTPSTQHYTLYPIHGDILHTLPQIQAYIAQIFSRHTHLLTQPFIPDHPQLNTDLSTKTSTTLRVITTKPTPHSQASVLYAQLEVPNLKKTIGKTLQKQFYILLPLDLDTLDISPIFQKNHPTLDVSPLPLSPIIQDAIRTSFTHCLSVHALLPLKSISVDIILSPQGPIILEANFNWNIELLHYTQTPFPL